MTDREGDALPTAFPTPAGLPSCTIDPESAQAE